MTDRAAKIRLFVEADLREGAAVALTPDQAHYLFTVMRLEAGATVAAFNGRDGEWIAEARPAGRKAGALVPVSPGQPQRLPPDLWLIFAPIKKARTDFIVEKAAELGCAKVQPVITRHTGADRVRADRLRAHAIEAAEQCGETWVPEVAEPVRFDALLDGWDAGRRLMFCDESRDARPAAAALAAAAPGPWAILIGPVGGFAPGRPRGCARRPSCCR
jgi:16S rRNA (uracil1498-N3)-methyltransferase